MLLRFPEAPAAFRRGVAQTLRDEQAHTRLYVERMKQCGIEFGELPVSGYFWRAVSPMENPMDYVAALSLTFEQANLDFCRHFARGFAIVGDAETAGLLEQIYRDEIAHVAYGLKWFRRWKNPQESDWEAFCRQLKFPLSPQRAKGVTLNVEGRRAAGFDAEFIAKLEVYAQSKGRTPGVFVFNPFAEGYIAQGTAFTPVKHQQELARDLENLPQFLGRQDDIVLVEQRPSVEFLATLHRAGFALPEFVERRNPDELLRLAQRKIGCLRPWAWGPDSMALLEPLFDAVTGEQRTGAQRFNESIARLYSKAWSADFLRTFLPSNQSDEPWLCSANEAGVAVETLDDAIEAIAAIRRRGHHKIVVKEALGLAGSNAIRLWEPEMLETQRRWIAHALSCGRQLVIEPWLEREVDFSAQLEMTPKGLELRGYTLLFNDRKGQFQGNAAAPNHARRIPASVLARFPEPGRMEHRLQSFYAELFARLGEKLRQLDYLGPLGIDAFVYRTPEGVCRIKPLVEINPRYTMGRLTVELMKQTAPGSHGCFRLVSRAQARAKGFEDFIGYARSLEKSAPIRRAGEPVPKLQEGAICLNDPARAQVCLAIFEVGRTALL